MIKKLKFDRIVEEVILSIGGKEFSFFNTNKVFLDIPVEMLDVVSPDISIEPFYITVKNCNLPDNVMISGILYTIKDGKLIKI